MSAVVAAVIATASGWISCNVNQPAAPIDDSVKTDLKVGKPISGQSSINIVLGFLNLGGHSLFADGVTYGSSEGGSMLNAFEPVTSAKSAAASRRSDRWRRPDCRPAL